MHTIGNTACMDDLELRIVWNGSQFTPLANMSGKRQSKRGQQHGGSGVAFQARESSQAALCPANAWLFTLIVHKNLSLLVNVWPDGASGLRSELLDRVREAHEESVLTIEVCLSCPLLPPSKRAKGASKTVFVAVLAHHQTQKVAGLDLVVGDASEAGLNL